MTIEFLEERRKALEEVFFQKESRKLLERLRAQREAAASRAALAGATGIDDTAILDPLLAQGVRAESATALALVPLLAVAWASGRIETMERESLLCTAAELGLSEDSPAGELLRHWLDERPPPLLLEAWEDYVRLLCTRLSAADRDRLASQLLDRARRIAESAGGVLGIGAVSASEAAVLKDLALPFEPPIGHR